MIAQQKRRVTLKYKHIIKMSSCYWAQVRVLSAQWGRTIPTCRSLEHRKVYCRDMQGEGWLQKPQTPQMVSTKPRWGRAVAGCCRLLGVRILCSCSCRVGQVRSGCSCKPPARQMLFSVLNFLNLYMNGKVLYPEKSEPWEWAILSILGSRQHS